MTTVVGMDELTCIPEGSILGLNYSGFHDTAIAVVDPTGMPLFAVSLERLSRSKADGRRPADLLIDIPWDRITVAAISAPREFAEPHNVVSRIPKLPPVLHST